MTGSAVPAVDVRWGNLYRNGRSRRGGTAIGPDGRLADDGKRCFSGGRWSEKINFRMGEGPGEGGTVIWPGRLADYGKCFSTSRLFRALARSRFTVGVARSTLELIR